MGTVDRDQFMRDGFLILRGFVLSDEVRQLRGAWETLLEGQKEIWRSQRGPDDPPGGEWDSSLQPRPQLLSSNDQAGVNLLDGDTISALEFWTSDRIRGVAGELLSVADAASGQICLMCNPTFDYGPAFWHRDWHPIDMGPMRHAQEAVVEHGPTLVQWNVPLYDDSVFWEIRRALRHIYVKTTKERARAALDAVAQAVEEHAGVRTHLGKLRAWCRAGGPAPDPRSVFVR